MKGVGVVAALSSEARTLGSATRRSDGLSHLGNGTLVALSGMGGAAAALAAHSLADAGACALMSFGLAGGLDPSLAAGRVVVPDVVVSADGARYVTSSDWRDTLSRELDAHLPLAAPVAAGKLLTSLQAIGTRAAKAAAFRGTGAVAVDMESLAVARVAAERKLPFIAVRVIVDTANDELPRAVVAASAAGQVRIWRLVGGLAMAPAEFVGLIRLARRYRAAIRSLRGVARAIRSTTLLSDVRVA